MFTLKLQEPFFITKLYVIECNRLQSMEVTPSRASINRVFINNYLFLSKFDIDL